MFKTASCITWAEISAHSHSITQQGAIPWLSETQVAFLFCSSLYIYKEKENHKRGCSAVVAGVSVERAQGGLFESFSAPLFQLFTILTLQCRV